MKEFIIKQTEANQRLDKYIGRIIPNAGFGFIHKMLRKKNITLNGKKAKGDEYLKESDCIQIFFSDETFIKMSESSDSRFDSIKKIDYSDLEIVFENKDMVIANKPFGMLSQKAKKDDVSINEKIISYLINNGYSKEDFKYFAPSVINRLDRNTGGLIIAAKTKQAASHLSSCIKDKSIRRIYNAVCHGSLNINDKVTLYYQKSPDNMAKISDVKKDGFEKIITGLQTTLISNELTLVQAELFTGKSHQIRAVCRHLGHPILNDKKYGDAKKDRGIPNLKLFGQYLFAKKIIFPDGMEIEISLPSEFTEVIS